MNTIIKEEGGINRLWRGNTSTLLRIAPYAAVQFAVYDFLKSTSKSILKKFNSKRLFIPRSNPKFYLWFYSRSLCKLYCLSS